MDLKLSGKRALVTGSSAGLGEAIVKLLAAEGVPVVVHGRDADRTHAVAKAIHTAGGRADIALGDLATDAGADAVTVAALAGGPIDILVNNARVYHHLTWVEATPRRWAETYEMNVLSGVRIQIGGLAIQPIPMQPDYNASLAARHNLAVSLARKLKGSGVTSNVVPPAPSSCHRSRSC